MSDNVLPFPTPRGASPIPREGIDPGSSAAQQCGSVPDFKTSTGASLRPPVDPADVSASASSGAGRFAHGRPAPSYSGDDAPSMSTLRRAVSQALLDGDEQRADMYRAVIDSRVRRAQRAADDFLGGDGDAAA